MLKDSIVFVSLLLYFPCMGQTDTTQLIDSSTQVTCTPVRGCAIGTSAFKPNGYNKIFNHEDKIWQEGEFRDGKLWNGKVYIYDAELTLIKIQIFKEGIYRCD